MKKFLLSITTIFTLIILLLSFVSLSLYFNLKPCLQTTSPEQITTCLNQIQSTKTSLKTLHRLLPLKPLTITLNLIDTLQPLLPYQDYLLGLNQPTSYLILLQNDTELRTNGGFFGSYAVTTLDQGYPSFRLQDIYVPDGQIQGHVDPPEPIQQAFRQGWFRLRDSDWDPDFTTAATTIRWFLDKGGEINPDLLITLPLSTIQSVLNITGPLEIPEYHLSLNSNNIFIELQNLVEQDFFPGSTQKKDLLTATTQAFTRLIANLPLKKQIQIIDVFLSSLQNQNILLNSTQPQMQTIFTQQNWAGQLEKIPCSQTNCLSDSLAIIETNLGANKANAYLKRHTTHNITTDPYFLTHQTTINYTNNSPSETPQPPQHHGGNYINYLRFYLPLQAKNITLITQPTLPQTLDYFPPPLMSSSPLPLTGTPKHDFLEIGFFHLTQALTSSSLTLSYRLPLNSNTNYQFSLLKQHGLVSSPQDINIFNKSYSTNLEQDFKISLSLPQNR